MKVEQKFKKGDLVRIVKGTRRLGKKAVIEGSYKDLYGGGGLTPDYCIHFRRYGKEAWYPEDCFQLIQNNRWDLVEKWEEAFQNARGIKGDLDWIFTNGKEVLDDPKSASIAALAKCFTDLPLDGVSGETFKYIDNCRVTLSLAENYLLEGDKEGWLKFCKEIRAAR